MGHPPGPTEGSSESPGQPEEVPEGEEDRPNQEERGDVRQHQGDDRADAGVLLVLGRERDDEGEIGVHRADGIQRRIADAVGREDGFGRDAQPHQERHEDGGEDGPLRERAGHDEVEDRHDHDEAEQQRQRAESGRFQGIAHVDGRQRRHVGVGEEGVELGDDEQQEDQAAEASHGLLHRLDDVDGALHGAGADAIGRPGREEHERDEDDQPVHERRVADERAGRRIAQRRPGGQRQQREHDEHAEQAQARVPEALAFRRRHGLLRRVRALARVDTEPAVRSGDR